MIGLVGIAGERLGDADGRCFNIELPEKLGFESASQDQVVDHLQMIELVEQRDVALELIAPVENIVRLQRDALA